MFRNMLPFDRKALKRLPWGLQKLRNLILRHLMLRSMRKADLTIFISDYAREFIQARTAVPNSETIPHGIPEQFLTHDQEIERPAETAGGDYILYVSRFEAYKHHREVIEAYGMLPANLQREVKLLLVGENDYAEGSQAIEFVAAKGLTDRVIFTGKISYDRLPAFYRNARAIVFASSCENCPNIMLEAMGSGRPLLASNVMPMPEFGGLDIAYFSPYEPETLRPQLQQVLTDQAYAAKLALASKERSQRYNWAVTAESTWRALYNLAQTVEIRHDI
ncbi:hypothetical protein ASD76_03735 [Altererythrobacter sp. Root672]|nr:hypothetical protein ASD76_03735 [Altererythrobacter sp. Root672]